MATKKTFKPCESCPTPAKCKASGQCMAKSSKGAKVPAVAIMIGVAKPKAKAKMAKGGMAKGKC